MTSPTPRHWALAAEAVTTGPMTERDIVTRVAHMLAHVETVAHDASRVAGHVVGYDAGYDAAQHEYREQQRAATVTT